MVSDQEGFVISHPTRIDKQDKIIPLTYYKLSKNSQNRGCDSLFSFSVLLDLLLTERSSRLYESMLPLLPRHYGNEIYFVDCVHSKENYNLNIYIYHLVDGKIKQLSNAQTIGQHFLCANND